MRTARVLNIAVQGKGTAYGGGRWTGDRTDPSPLRYVFSASECREAYGVRAACCRFPTVLWFPSTLDWRKRQQAARTPYASRHSEPPCRTYLVSNVRAFCSAVGFSPE